MDIEKCKKIFGERIQELRKDKGIKQAELAIVLNISRDMLSNYERGKYVMPDDIKLKIAKHFNVSLDYLIGAVDEQIPLTRADRIELPKDFPLQAIPEAKEFLKLMILKYREKK